MKVAPVVVGFAVAGIAVLLGWGLLRRPGTSLAEVPQQVEQGGSNVESTASTVEVPTTNTPLNPAVPKRSREVPKNVPALNSARADELIAAIFQTNAPLTAERLQLTKQNLAYLRSLGAAGIPAISNFLATWQDINLTTADGTRPAGYSSLRAGMFDVLSQIGGPEAQGVLLNALHETANSTEIQLLGRYLENASPGTYRQQIVDAALQTLNAAKAGQVPIGDAGPLFAVLREYGDAAVISELQKARGDWSHYATIALAGLPDGTGIPAILDRLRDSSTRKPVDYLFNFQVLGQAVGRRQEAEYGLVELAQQNMIPDVAWSSLARGITSGILYDFGRPETTAPPAGSRSGWETFHVGAGGQDFFGAPLTSRDADVIQARLQVIDRLLAVTQSPEAAKALNNAAATLRTQLVH